MEDYLYSDEFVECVREAIEEIACDDVEVVKGMMRKPFKKMLMEATARNVEDCGEFTAAEILASLQADDSPLCGAYDEIASDIIEELDEEDDW